MSRWLSIKSITRGQLDIELFQSGGGCGPRFRLIVERIDGTKRDVTNFHPRRGETTAHKRAMQAFEEWQRIPHPIIL